MPSAGLIVPLSVNRFPNKLAPNVPNNILRNPPFWFFTASLIISLMPFINKPVSTRDLTIFMTSFEIINVLIPDSKVFFGITPSVANAAANSNVIKTLLANDFSIFFISMPFFSNCPNLLPRNPSDCTILSKCVFDNFILADKPFAITLQSLATCVLVDKNLCEKLVSSLESPITFSESFKVTSVPLFIPDFNLLTCELDYFMFKVFY